MRRTPLRPASRHAGELARVSILQICFHGGLPPVPVGWSRFLFIQRAVFVLKWPKISVINHVNRDYDLFLAVWV